MCTNANVFKKCECSALMQTSVLTQCTYGKKCVNALTKKCINAVREHKQKSLMQKSVGALLQEVIHLVFHRNTGA